MNDQLRSALWLGVAGIAVLAAVLIGMMLKSAQMVWGGRLPGPTVTMYAPGGWSGGAGQQIRGRGGWTGPSFPQCFPNATIGQGAQLAATFAPGCVTCPNFTQCFPNASTGQGNQLAAYNPACPSFTQCYPTANAGQGGQLAAFQTTNAAPAIFRDAQMLHEFRGVCENCHVVMPDIAIKANAQLPHSYRGVCSNCHTIVNTPAGAF